MARVVAQARPCQFRIPELRVAVELRGYPPASDSTVMAKCLARRLVGIGSHRPSGRENALAGGRSHAGDVAAETLSDYGLLVDRYSHERRHRVRLHRLNGANRRRVVVKPVLQINRQTIPARRSVFPAHKKSFAAGQTIRSSIGYQYLYPTVTP